MPSVTTTSEQLETNRVKLRVEVPEPMLDGAIAAAYRRWGREIKVPGFRSGKVPREIIDARVGPDAVREEALRDALPELYAEALRAEELEAIAAPEIEVIEFNRGSPLVFEAVVDVRPEIELPDFASIKIEAPPPEVTEADVDEQLERLRDRFAELESAGREARRGDFVLIDLKGYHHDEPVEGASAPDYLYEIGAQTGPPKLDSELEGSRPGAILKFNDTTPDGQEISFTVLVKEVKVKKLPPIDDEFAKTVGEFDTLEELKNDLRERLATVKEELVEQEVRSRALTALLEATSVEPPEKLVEAEFEHRLAHLTEDLKRAGLTLDEYGRQVQLTELEIRRDLREQSARSVVAELLLEEIARREGVDVNEEELGRDIAYAAMRAGRDLKEYAKEVAQAGQVSAFAADIMRRKALDHVVDKIEVVRPDESGRESKAEVS